MKKIGIIGAGAWGTSLAITIAKLKKYNVYIWAFEKKVAKEINNNHSNNTYLKGIKLTDTIKATNIIKTMKNMDLILWVTPAQVTRDIAKKFAVYLKKDIPILICSKGIEQSSKKLMTEVIKEELKISQIGVLSGPTFAKDVANGLPIAITLAMQNQKIGQKLAHILSSTTFRIYYSTDVIGTQIGGAIKNVLAIACGISDGKNFGDSARSALTNRGFIEMCRFGIALNANIQTLCGLSGLGDLILTANSSISRNMSFGIKLGKGNSINQIINNNKNVIEGVHTSIILKKWTNELNINMPICQAIADIISNNLNVNTAIEKLLNRPLKQEII